MKEINKRRRLKIENDIKDIKVPAVSLLNRVDDKIEPLKEMVINKLMMDLVEQDCSNSGKKCYDWIIEDFKNCTNIEDFAWLLPQSYGNNGELHYNNEYNFFSEETEEDDLKDYSNAN